MTASVISDNWEWKQRDPAVELAQDFSSGEWLPATVPSNIHLELLKVSLLLFHI